jgi:RNA-directed DNA polymerase
MFSFSRLGNVIALVQIFFRDNLPSRVLKLIGRYLRAGVMVDGIIQATEWGTSQGSPLSPMLANILLDDLDKELEKRGHRFVRYMNDLVIFVKSIRAGQRVMAKMSQYLSRTLKLTVNRQKSQVGKVHALEYLGFQFKGIRVYWSDQAVADFKHRLRGLTARSWGVSMAYRLQRLNQYLRGWMHPLATQTGMTNEWLAQQGLLSIRDLWLKAQGYA